MILKSYTLSELDEVHKKCEGTVIPISLLRVLSQKQNPRAYHDAIVLTIAFGDHQEVLGFIGMVPGEMNSVSGRIRISWNSCWWVDSLKGKHTAMPLLLAFLKNNEGIIALKGLTAVTSKIIARIPQLTKLVELKGYRYFFRLYSHQIVNKKSAKPILKIVDFIFNTFYSPVQRLLIACPQNIQFQIHNSIDSEASTFIRSFEQKNLFYRDEEDLTWTKKFPWITADKNCKEESSKYPFSLLVKSTQTFFVSVKANSKIVGWIYFFERDGHYKTPYVYFNDEYAGSIAQLIQWVLIQKKSLSYVTHDSRLLSYFNQRPGIFYYKKTICEELYVSTQIANHFNKNILVYDGDGDSVFT